MRLTARLMYWLNDYRVTDEYKFLPDQFWVATARFRRGVCGKCYHRWNRHFPGCPRAKANTTA